MAQTVKSRRLDTGETLKLKKRKIENLQGQEVTDFFITLDGELVDENLNKGALNEEFEMTADLFSKDTKEEKNDPFGGGLF